MNEEDLYQNLFAEIGKLNNRLRRLGDGVHADSGLTAVTRSLLLQLGREGARTVPDLARERYVSRQIIQTQVNELVKGGYLRPVPNPRHRRSPLFELTSAGERMAREIIARETEAVRQVGSPLSRDDAREMVEKLRTVREHIDRIGEEECVERWKGRQVGR